MAFVLWILDGKRLSILGCYMDPCDFNHRRRKFIIIYTQYIKALTLSQNFMEATLSVQAYTDLGR